MPRLMVFCVAAVCLLTATFPGAPAFAAGEGQEDLDKAIEAKLGAEKVSDLAEVIRLAESAISRGLDKANAEFAAKLLASTLTQRGSVTALSILQSEVRDPNWPQSRQAALADLERAAELDAKQPQTFLLIAQLNLLLPNGDSKRAQEAIAKALEIEDANPTVRARVLLLRAGFQTEAKKKLVDLDEAVRLLPSDAAAVRARGLVLADMGELDKALVDLDKAIELAPAYIPTYETKALVLARLKRFDESLEVLEKARQVNPHSIAPLMQSAVIHSQQEKPEAALEDLNQALAMNPKNIAALLLRSGLYRAKNEKDKALADADLALQLKPDLPQALSTRAELLEENKQYDKAIQDWEKLRETYPKDVLTLIKLSSLYPTQKQFTKAIEVSTTLLTELSEKAQAAQSGDDASPSLLTQIETIQGHVLHGRGNAYLNIGKQVEAIADYEKALKLDLKDSILFNNLAWVLATSPDAKLRDGKRAIQLATEACEETKYELAFMLSTLAAAYAETGDFETAIKWSTKAVEIGDEEHDDSLKKELESYKAGKPWRELLSEEEPEDKPEAKP